MSEQTYGEASVEQAAGFVPLVDPNRPDNDSQTYEGKDQDAAREAADDLLRRRAEDQPPLIERVRVNVGGDKHGEPVDANGTVKLERSARDLAEVRASEAAAAEAEENQNI